MDTTLFKPMRNLGMMPKNRTRFAIEVAAETMRNLPDDKLLEAAA